MYSWTPLLFKAIKSNENLLKKSCFSQANVWKYSGSFLMHINAVYMHCHCTCHSLDNTHEEARFDKTRMYPLHRRDAWENLTHIRLNKFCVSYYFACYLRMSSQKKSCNEINKIVYLGRKLSCSRKIIMPSDWKPQNAIYIIEESSKICIH